jgi:HSP20 family protein
MTIRAPRGGAEARPGAAAERRQGSKEEGITMAIIRWNPQGPPMRDLVTMHEEMNRLFDSAFGRPGARAALDFAPVVDIEETPEQFVIRADLPGVAQKDIKVNVMGDTLTVRGERHQDCSERDGNWLRCERAHGTFERAFNLGSPVKAGDVKAAYKDGVLEIRVPKAEEAKLREIEVKVG